jgi:excisionase family DNA binding protein
MLKVAQIAERLNCSISTVYNLIESGRLGHHRCPGIRISETQLASFLTQARRGRDLMPPKRQPAPSTLRHIAIKRH